MTNGNETTPHQVFELGDFDLDSGVTLPAAEIAYATYGTLNEGRDNVIVFPSWFTGTHIDLEWFIGDGAPLDTSRYFVVVPSMFANGLSSSPSNTPPPFDKGRFPSISIQDNVRAQQRLLSEQFDVQGIELAIGGSMGAFQAYQWALTRPDLVKRVMPMCGAARVSRHCYVFLAGVKAALQADSAYAGGDYDAPPEKGLRAVGRVYAGWGFSQAFYRERAYESLGFESVDDFLVGFWEAFFGGLDANNLVSQIETWQSADIAATPGYDGDLERALGEITAEAFLAPAERDMYFRVAEMAWEAGRLPFAEMRVIPGVWGHLSEAGLDQDCMSYLGGAIRELLDRTPRAEES